MSSQGSKLSRTSPGRNASPDEVIVPKRRSSRSRERTNPNGLATFLHAFHTLVVGFLLFRFFYSSWSDLAEAMIALDDLQKYGLSVALIVGGWSLAHLINGAAHSIRTRE